MNRKKGLDFVRAISAIGIIVFHFYCHSSSEPKFFIAHANGAWGGVLNYLFFALSGLVLHMKYGEREKLDIRDFYYRRWKAMMPAYLIVFLYAFMMNVFTYGKIFYMDIPKSRLLLTLIGMDGYFSWITTTYFITGEWFLGAILIAYAAYPLLRILIKKTKFITFLALAVAYAAVQRVDFWGLPLAVNPVTCLLSFSAGMIMATFFQYFKDIKVVIPAAIVGLFLLTVPISGSNVTKEMLIGWSLLIVAYNVGELLCKNKVAGEVASFVSALSYPTFLLHHRIIYKVLEGFDSTNALYSFGVLLVTIAVTIVLAKVLDMVMKNVLNNSVFLKLEGIIQKRCER